MTDLDVVAHRLESELSPLIEQHQVDKDIPVVAVALVSKQEIVWRYERHVRKGRNLELKHNTLYRIGSITKLFTQLLIMQLIEANKLSLDARLVDVAPQCAPDNPFNTDVRIEHLLTHTSGIQRELPESTYFGERYDTLNNSVPRLRATALQFEPGTITRYSNAATSLLGFIASEFHDTPWEALVRSNIFVPLGLEQPHIGLETGIEVAPAVCRGYTGDTLPAPRFGLGPSPSGSLVMTLDDLAGFAQGLLNRGNGKNSRFIGRDTLGSMWAPSLSQEHGLGFFLRQAGGVPSFGHGGTIYGFSSELEVVPEKDLGVVVQVTHDIANGFARRLATTVLEAAIENNEREPVFAFSPSSAEQEIPSVLGTYYNQDLDHYVSIERGEDQIRIECFGYISELRHSNAGWVIDSALLFLDDVLVEEDKITINQIEHTRVRVALERADEQHYGINGFPIADVYERHNRTWVRFFGVLYQPLVTSGANFSFPEDSPFFAGEDVVLEEDAIQVAGARLIRTID